MATRETGRWSPPKPEVGSVVHDIFEHANNGLSENMWERELYLQRVFQELAEEDGEGVCVHTIETSYVIPKKYFRV